MRILIMATLLMLTSCSLMDVMRPKKRLPRTSNSEIWIGQPREQVELHPVFAAMPMETRKASAGEVITYQNVGRTGKKAECKPGAWGSVECTGQLDNVVCKHVFIIKGDRVASYGREGDCTKGEDVKFRPRHPDGSAMISNYEQENYDNIAW
jgi:hypothetical protein